MFIQKILTNDTWIVYEDGHDYKSPSKAITFAFDTETLVYLDGQIMTQNEMFEKLKECTMDEKRQRLNSVVWAWQIYDEYNGFFMTNSFDEFLKYQCRCLYKFGWCYNATFDFAQIDYKLLAEQKERWTRHEKKTQGKGYNKGQAWTFESVNNDMGARYAYKLWIPYKAKNRHIRVHAVEYRDFNKIVMGSLDNTLQNLDVTDNDGVAIRKLEMNYQAVNQFALTQEELNYCCNDVKGLYFAIKKYNAMLEEQTNNELHCFGKDTNVMTAGGIAKRELLRSMYSNIAKSKRLKEYQRAHPVTIEQDNYLRENHLYKGGISYVNEQYRGKLLTREMFNCPMYRYDVNSEYPYAMANIRDLVGQPYRVSYDEWLKTRSDEYEAILELTSVTGQVKENMLGFWYDNARHCYVDIVNEDYLHLMFEEEFNEMLKWYDLDYTCESVILIKRGEYAYRNYVDTNYQKKADAKAQGNKTLLQLTKLLLNSSYGKLSERIARNIGHYELNEETGAVHFIQDGEEIDATSIMSIFNGAKVTSFARVYILSNIRTICKNPKKQFVYIDTDSIHAFASYDGCDPYRLGALKLEAECDAVKYLLPKTYIDIEHIDEQGNICYHMKDGKKQYEYEAHSKGINVKAISERFNTQDVLTLDYLNNAFEYGQAYKCLQAINVRGGKALIIVEKFIAREELRPNEKINNGYYNEI